MPLRHVDGRPVSLKEWLECQRDIVLSFPLRECEQVDLDRIFFLWTDAFAARARQICDTLNVPVEIFQPAFVNFQTRITPHIENLKWAMSSAEGRDIGLERTMSSIHQKIERICNEHGEELVQFSMTFPYIGGDGPAHVETVDFPMQNACAMS